MCARSRFRRASEIAGGGDQFIYPSSPLAGRSQSNPDIIHSRPLVRLITGIQHAPGLDQQQLRFPRRAGFVLDAFLHHIHLTGANGDLTVPKFNHQLALQHDEGFIGVGMLVPDAKKGDGFIRPGSFTCVSVIPRSQRRRVCDGGLKPTPLIGWAEP